jgi:Flp pilus assembly pilin Flp
MMQAAMRLGLRWPFGCSHDGLMSEGNGLVRRWLREEHGQDLIEYALLCGAVGFAGIVAFSFVSTAMNSTYASWDTAGQTDQLVEVPDPVPEP